MRSRLPFLLSGLRFGVSIAAEHAQEVRRLPTRCLRNRPWKRHAHNQADRPGFKSILDEPVRMVSANEKKHGPGIIILILIPITAFALGTWQVKRLEWKTGLITKYEDRILKTPLPLPPQVNPSAVKDFDYRRVYTEGVWRHDQEMLIGPRIHDSKNGFLVITPLDRKDEGSKVLVNRGWIPKPLEKQKDRKEGLPMGKVVVEGLLREPFKKNIFTPDNRPELGKWYFPDVVQMAEVSGSEPIWIEETMG